MFRQVKTATILISLMYSVGEMVVISIKYIVSIFIAAWVMFTCEMVYAQSPSGSTHYVFEGEDGVIYPSNQYVKERQIERQKELENKPPTTRLRYRPVVNDPSLDPMNGAYKSWLEGVRDNEASVQDIDPEYEAFVKKASVLLFSVNYKELTPELRDLLDSIPADALQSIEPKFEPKGPIDIDRGSEISDPFPTSEDVDDIVGSDLALDMTEEKRAQVDTLLAMAYDAQIYGQTEGAISIYEEVLKNLPENKEALFGIATTYHRAGQLDQAREHYIELLKVEPENWPALNNLMVLAGEEAPESALKELKALEILNPEFSPIAAQIGVIYLRLNQLDEAAKYMTRAVMLSPENLAYRYNLAVVLDHGGHKKQAARMYKKLLEANQQGLKLPESADRIRERLTYIVSSTTFK